MPFTQSVGPYQGGNFLFQGLSSVGDKAAEAIKQLDENRKLDAYNDTVIQHAFQNNQMSREDYDKYIGSSRTAKTGIAAGLAANFIEDYKAEQLRSMKEQRQAQADYRFQQAAALNWQPTQDDLKRAQWTGNELIRTGPGKYSLAAYGGSGQDKVIVDPLEIAGKQIPGWGVNRKTGAMVPYGQGSSGVQLDETTGAPYWTDRKGDKHFLSEQQVMAGQMMPKAAPAQPPGGPGALQQALDAVGSIGAMGPQDLPGATAVPSQTPVPSATPAPQGGESVPVTAAPTAAVTVDPRLEAKVYLEAHGLPVTEANIKHYIENASKSK